MHISSSYAKILGDKLFHIWKIPQSGSKAEDGEERKRERAKVGDNNGQATHGARKHAWRTQAAWAKIGKIRLNSIYHHPPPELLEPHDTRTQTRISFHRAATEQLKSSHVAASKHHRSSMEYPQSRAAME